MSDPLADISGSNRAAILLMSLGETAAAEVLKHVDPQEVQAIGQAMAEIGSVSREQVAAVAEVFADEVEDHTALGIGSEDYLRNVLIAALGAERAQGVIDRILKGRSNKGLEALKWMEPKLVAELLTEEHPQVIAVVASHLSHDQAPAVLSNLESDLHAEVVLRIAKMDAIQTSALSDLDEIMEKRIAESRGDQAPDVGGTRTAADILYKLDKDLEAEVMEKIREVDDDLGSQIKELMFVFDSLAELDDRGMQGLLREISGDSLGVALKGAEPATQDKILSNMSSRAADILREDMEARGPVRLSEVEEAQKEILTIALKLAEEGKIQLGSSGDEYV